MWMSRQAGAHKGCPYDRDNSAHVVRQCSKCSQSIGKTGFGFSSGFACTSPLRSPANEHDVVGAPLQTHIPSNYPDVETGGRPQGTPLPAEQFCACGQKLRHMFSIHRTNFHSACSSECACTSPPHSPEIDDDVVGASLVGALVLLRRPPLRPTAARPQATPLQFGHARAGGWDLQHTFSIHRIIIGAACRPNSGVPLQRIPPRPTVTS